MILHTYTEIKIIIGNVTSNGSQVRTGFRQEDALSSFFFNIALEKVFRANKHRGT